MNNINLLRYHNRSAHEINMLLNGDISDQLFSRVVLGESDQRAGVSKLVLSFTVAASFVCALFASYVIYNVVILQGVVLPKLDKESIMKKVAEYQLELRTGGDPYLKDGYTKIAVVEKADEKITQPIVVISDYEPPIDYESKPELYTKPVELTGEPVKRKRDKRTLITPMFTGNHAIQFLDINESDAEKVRTLANNNDFNLKILGSTKRSRVQWQAFRDDDNSEKVIAGRNVRYIRSFETRDSAVNYLQKNKIPGLVVSRTTYYDYYDMEVCCLGDEAAVKLANGSGISEKLLRNNNKKR